MIKVKCDQSGAMIPAELEKAVQEAKSRGKVPFYVGTTAGSTVLGAFDDYEGCADVCEKHDMWMHVDGAWGGAAALSPTRRHNLQGANRADSFCWNPHKMLGLPLQCSIFVTKQPGALSKANAAQADYLFQPDKNNAAADLGVTVLRTWAFSDGAGEWRALQRAPGVYDEATFRGLGAFSSDWFPYDRVGAVNAVPLGLLPAHFSAHPSVSIPDIDACQLQLAHPSTPPRRRFVWTLDPQTTPWRRRENAGFGSSSPSRTTGSTTAARTRTTDGAFSRAKVAATASWRAGTISSRTRTRAGCTRTTSPR